MLLLIEEMAAAATIFIPPPPQPPPPAPPHFPKLRLPPSPSDLFNLPNVPRIDEFLNNDDFNFDFSNGYVSPAPDTLPLRRFSRIFFPNRPSPAKILSIKTNCGNKYDASNEW